MRQLSRLLLPGNYEIDGLPMEEWFNASCWVCDKINAVSWVMILEIYDM